MDWVPYAVVLIVFVFAAILGWGAVNRLIRHDPARRSTFWTWYRLFMTMFFSVLVLVFVASRGTSPIVIPQKFGIPLLIPLAVLLAIPIYFAFLRLERRDRRGFSGRLSIFMLCLGLPGVLYWLLVGGVDELVLAITVLGGAVVAILLLVWDLYMSRQRG